VTCQAIGHVTQRRFGENGVRGLRRNHHGRALPTGRYDRRGSTTTEIAGLKTDLEIARERLIGELLDVHAVELGA
jgi:hypothetical protein